jgi:hypothetical protein
MFDTCENAVVSKNFAASLGTLSWRELDTFFVSLKTQNLKYNELAYSNDTLKIVWQDRWFVTDTIDKLSTFRIVPLESMPMAVLQGRMTAFQFHQSQTDTQPTKFRMTAGTAGKSRSAWFDKHSQKRADESDTDFEFRFICICQNVFEAIRDHIPTKRSST